MPIGQVTQSFDYHKPPDEAHAAMQQALSKIGQVTATDSGSIQGTSRYGLQKVKMQIVVAPQGSGSRIDVTALSDDVWAAGAKNCIARLFEAIENLDNPNYVPSPRGMSTRRLVLVLIVFVALVMVILGSLVLLPAIATTIVMVVGLAVLGYFLVAKARFGKSS